MKRGKMTSSFEQRDRSLQFHLVTWPSPLDDVSCLSCYSIPVESELQDTGRPQGHLFSRVPTTFLDTVMGAGTAPLLTLPWGPLPPGHTLRIATGPDADREKVGGSHLSFWASRPTCLATLPCPGMWGSELTLGTSLVSSG